MTDTFKVDSNIKQICHNPKKPNNMNKDKNLIKLLKLKSISYLIAKTDVGDLQKTLRKDDDDYHYTLDSVPLDKETTEELLKLL